MIEFKENELSVDTYLKIRENANWRTLTREQAVKALENSIYTLCAYKDGQPVGMGRIVGDGAVICYVQDLVVVKEERGNHIGSEILNRLTDYVKSLQLEDTTMMYCLMCAQGRENFYKRHEFIARPTKTLGPGMIQYLKK